MSFTGFFQSQTISGWQTRFPGCIGSRSLSVSEANKSTTSLCLQETQLPSPCVQAGRNCAVNKDNVDACRWVRCYVDLGYFPLGPTVALKYPEVLSVTRPAFRVLCNSPALGHSTIRTNTNEIYPAACMCQYENGKYIFLDSFLLMLFLNIF